MLCFNHNLHTKDDFIPQNVYMVISIVWITYGRVNVNSVLLVTVEQFRINFLCQIMKEHGFPRRSVMGWTSWSESWRRIVSVSDGEGIVAMACRRRRGRGVG